MSQQRSTYEISQLSLRGLVLKQIDLLTQSASPVHSSFAWFYIWRGVLKYRTLSPPHPLASWNSLKYPRSRHSPTFSRLLEYKTEASLQIWLWRRIFLKVCVGGGGWAPYIPSLGRLQPHLGSGFQLLTKRHFSLWGKIQYPWSFLVTEDTWFFLSSITVRLHIPSSLRIQPGFLTSYYLTLPWIHFSITAARTHIYVGIELSYLIALWPSKYFLIFVSLVSSSAKWG